MQTWREKSISRGSSHIKTGRPGWSPLCYAVMTGQVALVRSLLKAKADVNDRITKVKQDGGGKMVGSTRVKISMNMKSFKIF